jgi:hypothetical protein
MNVDILIRSYAKDEPWLKYCLRSVVKFCHGFRNVVVIVPEYDQFVFAWVEGYARNIHLRTYPGNRLKPMLECMSQLCYADQYCRGADMVLHTDSDCVFTQDVTPDTYMKDGKPIILARSYDSLRGQPSYCWRASTENCLRTQVSHETMVRHPSVYWIDLYKSFRDKVESVQGIPFHEYTTNGPNVFPWYWAEFPALGFWAMKEFPTKYTFIDVSGMSEREIENNYKKELAQGWSHFDESNPADRAGRETQIRKWEEILK